MRYETTNVTKIRFRSSLPLMFGVVLIFACPNFLIGQSENDEIEFPYQALILNDGASIHSGPGSSHYATRKLKQGDAVEVYRHDPGGWKRNPPGQWKF